MPKKPRKRRYPAGSGGKITYPPPHWRFTDLIKGLGHEKDIVDKLVMRGYARVPTSTIEGWRRRNRIPAMWVPAFVQLGMDEKLINRVDDLKVATP